MQAELEHKFVFFKKETNPNLRSLIIASVTGTLCAVLMLGAVGLTVKKVASEAPKQEIAPNVVQKSFAAENVEIFKYFQTVNAMNQDELKKAFPKYEISFKEFKPMSGWMRKDDVHIHFDLTPQHVYISYNSLKLKNAYELKEAFNSMRPLMSNYETEAILEKDSVNIIVSNFKSSLSAQKNSIPTPTIYPAITSIEETVKANQETKKLMQDMQKKHNELVIQSTMDILQPLTPQKNEQSQTKKLNEQLESVKLNNLIIQEQIKQAELLKKLSKS